MLCAERRATRPQLVQAVSLAFPELHGQFILSFDRHGQDLVGKHDRFVCGRTHFVYCHSCMSSMSLGNVDVYVNLNGGGPKRAIDFDACNPLIFEHSPR
eukprot:837469-Amphidinium_carterae.1